MQRTVPLAPANPTGSKIILHQGRAAALIHLMLMMRLRGAK